VTGRGDCFNRWLYAHSNNFARVNCFEDVKYLWNEWSQVDKTIAMSNESDDSNLYVLQVLLVCDVLVNCEKHIELLSRQ
jgi:hypothetical protein